MARVSSVNDSGLHGAIRFGCRTMRHVFNADDDDVPFFSSRLRPDARLGFSAHHSESHVPGRHLNGLLAAEASAPDANADREILGRAVATHRRALMRSYGGSLPLALNRLQPADEPPISFCPHNLREGFHGLYALACHWRDDEAAHVAESSIGAIRQLWHPGRGWDEEQIRAAGLNYQACQGFVHGEARMLGPLVKLHRATGSLPALRLAEDLVEKLTHEIFLEDGAFTPGRFATTHAHSVTCCLSSLAQFADLREDQGVMQRVRAFYDNGLWHMRDAIGWSPESVGQTGSDHGEANNTGDIVETALILGAHGWPQYDHDAERILRAHLLPSQLLDVSFVAEPDNPHNEDGLRDVAQRHQGAWGFPAPYGHESVGSGRAGLSFNMDIVGGVTGSLCAAIDAVMGSDGDGHHIRLLLGHETDDLRLQVPYGQYAGGEVLNITVKRHGALHIQLPHWVDGTKVRVDPVREEFSVDDEGLHISEPTVGEEIRVHFALPEHELTLTQHHDTPINVSLQGDRVVAMDNLGADLTFFPALDEI